MLAVTPAQAESRAVLEQHVVFAVLTQLQTSDAIKVHDSRTVDAGKHSRIQFLLCAVTVLVF